MWNYLDRGVSPHGNSCHMKGIPAQTPPRFVWPTKPAFVQEGTARVRRQQGWGRPQGPVPLSSLALSPPAQPLSRWPPSRVPRGFGVSVACFSLSVALCLPSLVHVSLPWSLSVPPLCSCPLSLVVVCVPFPHLSSPTPFPLIFLSCPWGFLPITPQAERPEECRTVSNSPIQDAPPQGSDKCDKWDQRPWE